MKGLTLTPVSYADLKGWNEDRMIEALPAIRKSCKALLSKPMCSLPTPSFGRREDRYSFCQKLQKSQLTTSEEIRLFIENHLQPYLVSTSESETGTLTGYYEPLLHGSLHKIPPYLTPLYKRPPSSVHYKIPRDKIVSGFLSRKGLELVWVKDPIDAFFLQIQGSGRVRLQNGQEIRLGYAGQNGYPYFPIGKELLDRGILKPGNVTMHTIKEWLKRHPEEAESIMSINQSYVFFKKMGDQGPIGAQGVPLTPCRSMAIDPQFIALGSLLWLEADSPKKGNKLNRLMIAQDTGGAIKGPLRGDFFWGHGIDAEHWAGLMNSRGKFYLLLPK